MIEKLHYEESVKNGWRGWFSRPAKPTGQLPRKSPKANFLMLAFSLVLAIAEPVRSLEVRVSPTNPQLGDTLSVSIETENSGGDIPQVLAQEDEIEAFAVGANRFRALVPTTPLDRPGRWVIQVSGEGQTRNIAVWVSDRDFPTQSIWLPPGKDDLQGTDYEFDRVAEFKALVTPERFWNGPLLRPNGGTVTTIYGVRRYYNGVFAENYYHRGVDYAGGYGSPVVAPAAGRIALVGRESEGFEIHGNTVGIDHGQGVTSIMLHLNRIDVREGQMVRAGEVIGGVGSTGASTGPHLHWGLYVHGKAVDPVPWRFEGVE